MGIIDFVIACTRDEQLSRFTCDRKCERMILQSTDGISVCRSVTVVLLLLDSMHVAYRVYVQVILDDTSQYRVHDTLVK